MRSASPPYAEWVRSFDTLSNSDVELIRADIDRFKRRPRITVAVLCRMAGPDALRKTLKSISEQIYREFELIVVGEMDANGRALEQRQIELRRLCLRGSPAEDFNAAVEAAAGEFLIAVEAGDTLARHALYLAARHAIHDPQLCLIFGDQDELTAAGHRENPFFKSDWNPELILGIDYIGNCVFYQTDLLRSIGGSRALMGDSWRWDLTLRASEQIGAQAIRRIPFILYHETSPEVRLQRKIATGVRAVTEAMDRRKQSARALADPRGWVSLRRLVPDPAPHVTIIVPTRDRCELLRRCVAGILERTAYPSFDLIIIDNGSEEQETREYLHLLQRDPRISVITDKDDFNFARMHNRIVPGVRGEVVALLNNDIDVIGSNWLEIMVSHALQSQIGVVGAKLFFPDRNIQHAGIVIGLGGAAGHVFSRRVRVELGPAALLGASQDVSAVTGACMVLRRSVFGELRGFNEDFAMDYNDVDFCLRLRQHGYRVIWAADAELHHLESATRGSDVEFCDPRNG